MTQPRAALGQGPVEAWLAKTNLLQRAALLVATTLVAAGIVVGYLSISVAGLDGALSCGSAFKGSEYRAKISADQYVAGVEGGDSSVGSGLIAACDSERSNRRGIAIGLLVVGVVIGAGGVLAFRRSELSDPPPTV